MPTDEDRREVAARLRNWESFRETFMESPICAVIDALGVEDYLDWRGVFELLADLIEPEPERTCEVTEYNDCGPHAEDCTIVLSCGHRTLGYIPNYCPSCGAKVVSDDN